MENLITTDLLTEFCKYKHHDDFADKHITRYTITNNGSVVFIWFTDKKHDVKHEGYLYADIVELTSFMWHELKEKTPQKTFRKSTRTTKIRTKKI